MITFIVLTKNNPSYIIKCLQSLAAQTRQCWDAIVVDTSDLEQSIINNDLINKFNDPVINPTSARINHWQYVLEPGFAAKNNMAIKEALKNTDCKFICLLNDDAYIGPTFVEDMINAGANYTLAMGFSPLYIYANERDKIQVAGGGWFSQIDNPCGEKQSYSNCYISNLDEQQKKVLYEPREIDYGYGAAIVYRREVFEKVGYLDEVFRHGFDEPDFAKRIALKGYKIMYIPTPVYHVCAGSSKNKKWWQNLNAILPATRCYYYFLLKHYSIDYAVQKGIKKVISSINNPKSFLLNIYSIIWLTWMAQEVRGHYHDLYDPVEPTKFEKEELAKKGIKWKKPKIPFKIKMMDILVSYSFAIGLITFCSIIILTGMILGW